MRRTALVSIAALLFGGCADLLGLGDFEAGDGGAAGSGGTTTTTTSTASTTSSTSDTGGSGGATSSSSTGGGGSGGSPAICTPNEVRACDYAGPAGTDGVGLCKAATKTCALDGMSFGPCAGEVTPALERCDTLDVDEDCDGLPACSGAFRWAKIYGDAGGQLGTGVAFDPQGNVVLIGRISGTVKLGDMPITAKGNDAFVMKLDPEGRYLWSKVLGGTGEQIATAVAVDPTGNIAVTGTATIDLDLTQVGGGMVTGKSDVDLFVVALDPDGNHRWNKLLGGPLAEAPTSIAIDPGGDVVIAGGHSGGIDFGNGVMIPATIVDAFVAKLAKSDGGYVWAKSAGDTGIDRIESIAIDGAGAVLVTGVFPNKISFGGAGLMTAGGNDIFVAKLANGDGSQIWAKAFGDLATQSGTGIAVDHDDNVIVVGYGGGTFSLGGGNLGSGTVQTGGFVAKLDPGGAHLWSIPLGGLGVFPHVAVDDLGGIVIAAPFAGGSLTFGGAMFATAGQNDYAIGKLGSDGAHLWSYRFGDSFDQNAQRVAVGPTGAVAVAGGNAGTLDFGGGPLVSAGQNDVIVAVFAP